MSVVLTPNGNVCTANEIVPATSIQTSGGNQSKIKNEISKKYSTAMKPLKGKISNAAKSVKEFAQKNKKTITWTSKDEFSNKTLTAKKSLKEKLSTVAESVKDFVQKNRKTITWTSIAIIATALLNICSYEIDKLTNTLEQEQKALQDQMDALLQHAIKYRDSLKNNDEQISYFVNNVKEYEAKFKNFAKDFRLLVNYSINSNLSEKYKEVERLLK